jgi:hypothetical protein
MVGESVGAGVDDGLGQGEGVQPDEAEGAGVGPELVGLAIDDGVGPEPHAASMATRSAVLASPRMPRPDRHGNRMPRDRVTASPSISIIVPSARRRR